MTTAAPSRRMSGRARGRELFATLVGTRTAALPATIALVAVRIVLVWVFVYHGSRRLFGWFGGPGIHASALYFANTAGLRPGTFFAVLGGITEFFGALALAVGLLSRLAGAAIFADMMMAIITVTWANGINATGGKSGYELNLALGTLALVIAIFGAGRLSVDALLERRLRPAPGAAEDPR